MKIELTEGRWLVNGKRLEELSAQENSFLNMFFIHRKNHKDEEQGKYFTERKAAEQSASISYHEHQKQVS